MLFGVNIFISFHLILTHFGNDLLQRLECVGIYA